MSVGSPDGATDTGSVERHCHHDGMTSSLPDFETIALTEVDDDIFLVTLNRPDRLNAITSTMIAELERVVEMVNPVLATPTDSWSQYWTVLSSVSTPTRFTEYIPI